MTTLTISIIVVFVLGYALIATESLTKVNKAAIALLMLVGCWTLYMMDPMQRKNGLRFFLTVRFQRTKYVIYLI